MKLNQEKHIETWQEQKTSKQLWYLSFTDLDTTFLQLLLKKLVKNLSTTFWVILWTDNTVKALKANLHVQH